MHVKNPKGLTRQQLLDWLSDGAHTFPNWPPAFFDKIDRETGRRLIIPAEDGGDVVWDVLSVNVDLHELTIRHSG